MSHHNSQSKLLNLNVMPQNHDNIMSFNYIPIISSNNIVSNAQNSSFNQIPLFNHVPIKPIYNVTSIQPIISDKSTLSTKNATTLEEKDHIRKLKQQEYNARYRSKIKPYVELAMIPNEEQKITQFVKLCQKPSVVVSQQIPIQNKEISQQLSLEEKEEKRLEKARNHVANHRKKLDDYKKIATLKSQKEKIMRVTLLCYPL